MSEETEACDFCYRPVFFVDEPVDDDDYEWRGRGAREDWASYCRECYRAQWGCDGPLGCIGHKKP